MVEIKEVKFENNRFKLNISISNRTYIVHITTKGTFIYEGLTMNDVTETIDILFKALNYTLPYNSQNVLEEIKKIKEENFKEINKIAIDEYSKNPFVQNYNLIIKKLTDVLKNSKNLKFEFEITSFQQYLNNKILDKRDTNYSLLNEVVFTIKESNYYDYMLKDGTFEKRRFQNTEKMWTVLENGKLKIYCDRVRNKSGKPIQLKNWEIAINSMVDSYINYFKKLEEKEAIKNKTNIHLNILKTLFVMKGLEFVNTNDYIDLKYNGYTARITPLEDFTQFYINDIKYSYEGTVNFLNNLTNSIIDE